MTSILSLHRNLPLLCLWIWALGLAIPASAAEGGIQVAGEGEVRVTPDMARVTLEVRREGTDPAALKTELDEVAAAVLALGRSLDIDERDVTAAAVNIYPRYRRDGDDPRPDGVVASRTLTFTVRELDQLAAVINGALEQGANGVSGVQLDASNRQALSQEALDLAIDDAVDKARRMARRFQVQLGTLTAASTHEAGPRPMMMESMAARDSGNSSFSPGELIIRQTVQATFAIEP